MIFYYTDLQIDELFFILFVYYLKIRIRMRFNHSLSMQKLVQTKKCLKFQF